MNEKLNLWTIYNRPADFPDKFVARRFEMDKPTNDHFACENIEDVRKWVLDEAGKYGQGTPHCLQRDPNDHESVVETWL